MNLMKKIIYVLMVSLVGSTFVLTSCENKKETQLSTQKTLTIAEQKANLDKRKKWEASPDGIAFNQWKNSAEGQKIKASHVKIVKHLKEFSNMEAVVTSVTFQRENAKSQPKWLIVKIDNNKYMMQFIPKEFEQLSSLNVNDKIIVRSRNASFSPNHPYLILSSDYIEHDNKVLFKRDFSKNKGC